MKARIRKAGKEDGRKLIVRRTGYISKIAVGGNLRHPIPYFFLLLSLYQSQNLLLSELTHQSGRVWTRK